MGNKYLIPVNLTLGCDPEFFFKNKSGEIVGSELVLPKTGRINATLYGNSSIVNDGVQVELNPHPSSCRESLGSYIGATFQTLKAHLQNLKEKEISASFDSVVEMDPESLAKLSESARVFGCAPSLNINDKGKGAASIVGVDASTYMKRSAGGHIHVGLNPHLYSHRERLVPLFDILVGNTSVMIDRHPLAGERRKVYGRAGEYRLPKHGIEYRTLSNFWLRHYTLMHLVMGLTRMACYTLYTSILADPKYSAYQDPLMRIERWDAEGELLKSVDLVHIQDAINNNDLDLARHNFQGVKEFILTHVKSADGSLGLNPNNMKQFEHFCKVIEEKGLETWFPDDPLTHWCEVPGNTGTTMMRGCESWLERIEIPGPPSL